VALTVCLGRQTIDGSAVIPDPSKPGQLKVSLDGKQEGNAAAADHRHDGDGNDKKKTMCLSPP
jgi:hypothetical protein